MKIKKNSEDKEETDTACDETWRSRGYYTRGENGLKSRKGKVDKMSYPLSYERSGSWDYDRAGNAEETKVSSIVIYDNK